LPGGISTAALLNARPTTSAEGSRAEQRSSTGRAASNCARAKASLAPDRVEPRDHVEPGVPGPADLVEQRGGDGVAVDHAPGAGVLGDHAGAVGGELGQREAGVQELPDRVLL
jgi:hypothetical protein